MRRLLGQDEPMPGQPLKLPDERPFPPVLTYRDPMARAYVGPGFNFPLPSPTPERVTMYIGPGLPGFSSPPPPKKPITLAPTYPVNLQGPRLGQAATVEVAGDVLTLAFGATGTYLGFLMGHEKTGWLSAIGYVYGSMSALGTLLATIDLVFDISR